MVKFQVFIGFKAIDQPTQKTMIDNGISIEIPDVQQARNLYKLLEQIVRDSGNRLGATRHGAVNVKPLGSL